MKLEHHTILKSTSLDTQLGPMIAIADEHALYLLEFVDRPKLAREIERLKTKSTIIPGTTLPIHSIEKELHYYFDGNLKEFKTPLCLIGTPFQQSVWNELKKIPLGQTVSYADIAYPPNNPTYNLTS
jgi:AraC family transcriptional regulator of adaptative response/methylated-DNA-[protein]-cysteine methyltransferase